MPKNTVTDPITDREMAFAHLKISRDQILDRLWELANLSHEVTRGIIAGQMRALTMIVAIEGLIPDRRSSSSATPPAAPPPEPDIYTAKWLRERQHKAASGEPADADAATEAQPGATQVSGLQPQPLGPNDDRQALNRVPLAEDSGFRPLPDNASSPRQPFSIRKGLFTRRH
jgi:hypothetical protein